MPVLLAWVFLAQAAPKSVRMDVTFAGERAGESTYDLRTDGGFRSRTRFELGVTPVDSSLEGNLRDGAVARYRASVRQGEARSNFDYVPGKLVYAKEGQKGDLAYTIPAAYAASLHPQIAARLLAGLSAMKEGERRTVRAYLLDQGAETPVTIEADATRSVRVENRDERVRRFHLTIAADEIEFDLNAADDVVAMDVPGRRLRFVVRGWEGLFETTQIPHPELSQPTFETERVRNLRMRTRDGATLVADVVKPTGRGRFPAILERTPSGRETALALGEWWARRGYVYVAQDCRGRGDSDGEWDPFVNEGRDGYDAVGWVARQGWCDGNVGMIGGSYAGAAQWQAAIERPAALRAIVPQVAPSDAMHDLPYEYGTFDLLGALGWSRLVDGKPLAPANSAALRKLPLGTLDRELYGRTDPVYQSWLRRPFLGDWKGFDHLDRMFQVQVPALHVAGWFDPDGIGTKLNWEAMRRAGRRDQWLVYGPWTHAFNTTTRYGDLDFGEESRFDLDGLTLRFFDTYLKRRTVGMDEIPRAQVFVVGANRWVPLDGWPAKSSALVTRYLAPNSLVPNPAGAGAMAYTYDPLKDKGQLPRPTTKLVLPPKETYALFKGELVTQPTAVAGPFEVRLFFKSDAKDTDFFATLVDLAPDGALRMIGQPGKLRAAYRDGLAQTMPLVPGRHATALIRPGDGAYELARGHRLGLLVTSSMFPASARNLGTGEPLATGRRAVPQRNAILTGAVTPSRITYRKLW